MFFELDDIKRRHSLYWDVYNANSWATPADSTWRWNYQRGMMIGVTAAVLQETLTCFHENYRLLLKHYEPPKDFKQVGIYVREILKMENFQRMMKTRNQYALTIGVTDIASRIAVWRYAVGGWQRPFGSFDYSFKRKIPGALFAAAITAPIGVPFEVARMAYYADKTFPKELQRGYSSYFNALRRIPFEEGPYFLFKNSFPIYFRNFLQTFTAFYTFDFLKDKASWMWRLGDVPYWPCKVSMVAFSTWLACVFTYPWAVVTREMVEFWPQQRGGKNNWNNNYRSAAVWLWYHDFYSTLFPGFFKNYFWRQFPLLFTTTYLSDSLGIFTQYTGQQHATGGTNSWEDSFY